MITQQLISQRLAMVFVTGLLSTGLLVSGCSNNDNANTDTNNKAELATDTADSQTVLNDSNPVDNKSTNKSDINDTDISKPDADVEIVSQKISPIAAAVKEPSILTNRTQAGTPEDTVKLALDTLYYGDVEKSATYYKVDMENFAEELKNTQFAFKQTVEAVTIIDTKYNDDKTKATITGELRLKGQDEPAPLAYDLQKINGEWKILG